jgi:hypothetical protein
MVNRPNGQSTGRRIDQQKGYKKIAFEVANESVIALNIADEVVNAINDEIGEVDGEINRDYLGRPLGVRM